MPHRRFISLYGKNVVVSLPEKALNESDIPGLIERLALAIKILKGIVRVNHRILKIIHKVMALRALKVSPNKHKPEIRKHVQEIERLYPLTKHPLLSLLSSYHFHLELYLKKKQVREIDSIKGKKWVKLDRQLDRGLNFYAEIIEAADLLIKELKNLKRELSKQTDQGEDNVRSATG
jgi:hypothetical protein